MKLYIRTPQTADRIVLKVDVPGPHGTTSTEIHVTDSIEKMRDVISISDIDREDVHELSGCDLDDLFEI